MCLGMQLVLATVTEMEDALENDRTSDCIPVPFWESIRVMPTFVFVGGGAGVCLLCFVLLLRGLQAC